ncbi:ABC transporter permease [Streptococcus agalactiae]|uniref:ABC transporter permease n=1 Tax=Streptococcus TaxID=1301 RepID=UPI0002B952E4|nr:ABC transporter permease [Streptococcus agalactiae]MCQ8266470.1 ABC transporter permease [Streptococcus suis]AOQ20029.1 ABC transporter permease [Streptococcus agalactiae]EPU08779.1 ABC transporter [Streptococcus agalactiae STIR-CD-21]EPU12820.1 ABC transporter [Streptococcus agalactiae STIR-CD-22]MCC9701793.1 ABC transporter permease [Streptococcus agalactiae]
MNTSQKRLSKFGGLVKWSLLRHKFYIPVFVVVQIILSFAVIYGFLFITNATNQAEKFYLSTGAMAINVIAVTCVLAPQIISEAKQNGIYDYQKTLPVSRIEILMSDLLIWGLLCLPGILSSILISKFGFGLEVSIGLNSTLSVLLIIFSLLSVGFAIAYILPPNLVSLVTQLIMIGGLLFSPILYAADRLPSWMITLYDYLPFVPSSQIIRSSIFQLENVSIQNFIVLITWSCLGFILSLTILSRRK